jgi:hypothetical protein
MFPDIPQKLFGASVTLEGAYRVGSAGQPSPGYPDIDAVGSVIWSVYQRGPDTNLARVFDCRNFTTPATTGSSGAEQYPVGSPFQVSLNTLRAGFKNISIYHAFDNNMIVLDLSGAETCDLEGVWVDNGLRPPVYEDHVFTGTNGWSIWFPATFNENICRFDRSEVRGSFNGLDGGTSVIGANNNIQGCVRAWTFYTGGGNPIVMTGLHITSCLYYFYNPVGDGIPMFISGLSCENSIGGWWSSPSMFYDPFATISGEISFVGNPVQITVTNRVRLSHYMIGADNPVRDAYQLSPFVVSNSITAVHMKLSPLTGNNSGNIAELSWSTNSLLIPSNQRTMYFDGANWVFVNNDTSTEYWRISAAHAMTFGGSSYTFGSGTINHSGTFFGDGWSAAGGVLAANTSVGTAANAVPKIFGTTIVVTNLTMTTTSTAPTSVTVGVTAPDFWLVVTNNGLQLKVPAWTNH